jgi:hypothetical protein
MVFVLVFVIAMLLVPVLMDVERHGADNILFRSGQDILHFKWVVALREFIHSGRTAVGNAITMGVAGAILFVFSYVFLKLLTYFVSHLSR